MPAEITQLITYPVKSCAGIMHQNIELDAWGLKHDRKWMIVDQNQLFISQRKHPEMALIVPTISDGQLHLSAPGMADCAVQINAHSTVEVTVWKDRLTAELATDATNQWLSQYLGVKCVLVQFGQASRRLIDPEYAKAGDQVKFADGFPLLVTHQASLDAFNYQQKSAIPMDRFRPNVVLKSKHSAWSEFQWQTLSNAQVLIELPKPCARCVITGVNQLQGKSEGSGVLKRLSNEFSFQGKALFGMNGIARMQGTTSVTLQVGMSLDIQNK